jgi:hypothetical protein
MSAHSIALLSRLRARWSTQELFSATRSSAQNYFEAMAMPMTTKASVVFRISHAARKDRIVTTTFVR